MSDLSFRLLGQIEITQCGQSLKGVIYKKALAVLAYLAVEQAQVFRRDDLALFFWPDAPREKALGNLRYVLHRLRGALANAGGAEAPGAQEACLLTGDRIGFNPKSAHRLDVLEFLGPVHGAAIGHFSPTQLDAEQKRLDLYRGPFLDGLTLDDCPDFTDWLVVKREACHRHALALLERLIALHEKNGDLEKALRHAGRHLELEPWNEGGHRKLMSLLAQDGQLGAALAQYEACKKVLEKELGAVPDAQTTELFEKIKAGKLAPEVAKPYPFSFLGQATSEALNKPLNILIVDDHLLFRAGLSLMLNELGSDVTVFEAASCEDALALTEPEHGFDIILLDLKFPGMSGIDGLVGFKNRYPATPVVLFSSDEDMSAIRASYLRGAKGYISKAMSAQAIKEAIEKVLSREVAFPFGFVNEN